MLGYAYILTNNKLGIPCVYHPDYYEPLHLRYQINGLMEAHQRYIYGATQTDYLNRSGTPFMRPTTSAVSEYQQCCISSAIRKRQRGHRGDQLRRRNAEAGPYHQHRQHFFRRYPDRHLCCDAIRYQIVSGDNQCILKCRQKFLQSL